MYATAGGAALPGEDGKAAQFRPRDCSPKGLVITNHGPRRFLVAGAGVPAGRLAVTRGS